MVGLDLLLLALLDSGGGESSMGSSAILSVVSDELTGCDVRSDD